MSRGPLSDWTCCRGRVKAIDTHHGVLDIPTVEASCRYADVACVLPELTEAFIDK